MHSACPGCTPLGSASATYRADQQYSPGLPLRSKQAASFQRTAGQAWGRECTLSCSTIESLDNHKGHYTCCGTGNRRRPPAVLSKCFLVDRLQISAGAKHRAAQTRLSAFHYDYLNPPELSNKPLDVLKRRLCRIFPILANEELVSRAAWTLMVIAIARLGQQLRLPYLDANIPPDDGAGCTLPAMHICSHLPAYLRSSCLSLPFLHTVVCIVSWCFTTNATACLQPQSWCACHRHHTHNIQAHQCKRFMVLSTALHESNMKE